MARFGSQTPNFARGGNAAKAADAAAPQAPAKENIRRNKFGARCANCQVWVAEGEGRLENQGGKWVVSHIPPCPEAEVVGQDSMGDVVAPARQSATATPFKVPDGRYTVTFEDGSHKTIRVQHQDEFDDFMPGKAILKFLSGANNDRDYTGFAHVDERGEVRIWKKHQGNESLREAVKVLLGDPKAASKAYAQESGSCGVCGRTLTTPESLAAMIGPDCAKRLGW